METWEAQGHEVAAHHFRNYSSLRMTLAPTWTALVGPNGAGKTNFLELLTVAIRGVRLRGHLSDLILWGKEVADLHLRLPSGDILETRIERHHTRATRVRSWNGAVRPVPETLLPPLILFLPGEDALLDHPQGRRRLLGRGLLMQSVRYHAVLREYQRLLEQRNALLRGGAISHASPHTDQWVSWTTAIIEPLRTIWEERLRYVAAVNEELPEVLDRLGGITLPLHVRLRLGGFGERASVPSAADVEGRFRALQGEEVARGATLVGPHRDHVEVTSDGRDALPLLSRGQRRILLLALHIIEGRVATSLNRPRPLFVFDDVLSELDPEHRAAVRELLKNDQVVLTTADPHILTVLSPETHVYTVDHGTVRQVREHATAESPHGARGGQ